MIYITNTDFKLKHTAVSLGKFDGLHIGHRILLNQIISLKEQGLQSVVFTFAMHPFHLFKDKGYSLIYTTEEKKYLLDKMGLDGVVCYPFDKDIAAMEPEDFIKDILIDKLDARVIAVGKDFRFGHERKGNVELLKDMSKIYGFQLLVYDKVRCNDTIVSSSYIREQIKVANLTEVNQLLGYPYSIIGKVVQGNQIGRTLGMPTANMIPEEHKLLPPNGVYVSETVIDQKVYKSITNIGYKPTVGGETKKGVETYVFDFSGDLYGQVLEVRLYHFQRGEEKFQSLEALKARMFQDKEMARNYFIV